MGKYIISYIVFIVSTLAIMFLVGFVVGIFALFFADPIQLQLSLQGGTAQFFAQLLSVVVGFFCFRFSIKRFVESE
ncbi:MAG TPA: hypothetical protein DEG65_03655 [Methylophaga sp.]|nr:hypothetical protein [Methylophaga sp.]